MNVLFTSNTTGATWRLRGEQLGGEMGGVVIPRASNIGAYDCVVAVKRASDITIRRAREYGVPLVWDATDAVPVEGDGWTREECLLWLRDKLKRIRPSALVVPTHAMAQDAQQFGLPVLVLPMHAREEHAEALNPMRELVQRVGYMGAESAALGWIPVLQRQCKARGWELVLNPDRLEDVDILVSVRDAVGYAAMYWRTTDAHATAQHSGTPFVGSPLSAYMERGVGNCERWVVTEGDLDRVFSQLAPRKERERSFSWTRCVAPTLASLATKYAVWLNSQFGGKHERRNLVG